MAFPVQNPFFGTVPDVPSRGRFAAFCSKALSSVPEGILLNTVRHCLPPSSSTRPICRNRHLQKNPSPFLPGPFIPRNGRTLLLGGGGSTLPTRPVPTPFPNRRPMRTSRTCRRCQAQCICVKNLADRSKFYGRFEGSGLGVRFPDVDSLDEGVTDDIFINNRYNYLSASYRELLGEKTTLFWRQDGVTLQTASPSIGFSVWQR